MYIVAVHSSDVINAVLSALFFVFLSNFRVFQNRRIHQRVHKWQMIARQSVSCACMCAIQYGKSQVAL